MPMQPPVDKSVLNSEPAAGRPVRNLEFKAALLLIFTALLVAGSVLYLLHARGAFQATQTLVLLTDDAEGVVVGMDMSFSGFPIGRVRRVELSGNVLFSSSTHLIIMFRTIRRSAAPVLLR